MKYNGHANASAIENRNYSQGKNDCTHNFITNIDLRTDAVTTQSGTSPHQALLRQSAEVVDVLDDVKT